MFPMRSTLYCLPLTGSWEARPLSPLPFHTSLCLLLPSSAPWALWSGESPPEPPGARREG